MGERGFCKPDVDGSIPFSSTVPVYNEAIMNPTPCVGDVWTCTEASHGKPKAPRSLKVVGLKYDATIGVDVAMSDGGSEASVHAMVEDQPGGCFWRLVSRG